MSGISKSQVSRLCEEIDSRVKTFLEHHLRLELSGNHLLVFMVDSFASKIHLNHLSH